MNASIKTESKKFKFSTMFIPVHLRTGVEINVTISLGNSKLEESQTEEITTETGEILSDIHDMNAHWDFQYTWARVKAEDREDFYNLQNGEWTWVN